MRLTTEARAKLAALAAQRQTAQWATVTVAHIALTAAVDPDNLPPGEIPWTSEAIMFVDTPTGDGRDFAGVGTTHRALPLPLMCQSTTPEMGGHAGAVICGRIDTVDLGSFPAVPASGVFDDSDMGREAARLVAAGMMDGVSVDLAIEDYELEFVTETIEEDGESFEVIVDVLFHGLVQQIMGATHTPFPAFADARLGLGDMGDEEEPEDDMPEEEPEGMAASVGINDVGEAYGGWWLGVTSTSPLTTSLSEWRATPPTEAALLASAAATDPDPSAFVLPTEPIPWTVDRKAGTVRGFVALSHDADGEEMCHVSFPDRCVCPPRSQTGYARYLLREIQCCDGTKVGVGPLCLRGGHANPYATERAALDHYDNTDSVAAWVTAGEVEWADGRWGIAVAGIIQPDLDDAQLRKLELSSPSGDWRPYPPGQADRREMIAVSMVPVPGFPQVIAASGSPFLPRFDDEALVAAGALGPAKLKAEELRIAQPATVGDLDALAVRLAGLEERHDAIARALSRLEPDVRGRVLAGFDG